ncbi:MAG TPA: hemolysin family protein [Methanoregulaceae archaeon]|jgi:CBS domain containing-hemolysin-like protein|nr:HlyC/CorC family transporter [Methanolinea sp.]MDD5047686.1 hemolysin family protein [Methanoregulaceae archaeon]MDD5684491.1 hemolysin family protein [Methanoregulaceae archaeon]HOP66275.1 hemolysin family protein [Methanoregulaceae archaeon]HPJ74131.1 hemolysin family protein [Methanoregulaceae archaeon]
MIEDYLLILLFVACLLLSAFFSGSEVALISITRAKVRTLVNEGRKGAERLAAVKDAPNHFLITILIGNNIVNVAAASIATAITISIFGDIGVGIATFVVVILLLFFGEIGPKMYATRHTEKMAIAVSGPILVLSRIFSPLVVLIEKVTGRLGVSVAEPAVTEEEIREWIEVGKEEGTIEQEEREMLYSVLEFGDTIAREIMTPRVDVALVEDTDSLESALRLFNETGFSRIPVYREQVDNIIGVLNVKDVFSALMSGNKNIPIKDVMYDPFLVPETKKIDDLLKELQVRKVQMAVVLDEYSSFVGIVTVEDILEELVGDILDEFDKEEPEIQKVSEGIYVVDATVWVEDLNDELDISLPMHESYETIGGLLIDRLGHIPHPGESVYIQESHVTLVVLQMLSRRIVKVKMIMHRAGEGTT